MGELKDILLNFGAIAGFAGIIGLAVLAMLYFSQARDVRRLREWAGREPERAGEIELRAQQIASQAIAQAYESMAMRQSEASAAAGIAQDAGHEISSAPLVAADAGQTEVAEAPLVQTDSQETQAHDVVAHEFGEETDVDEAAHVVEEGEAEAGDEAPAEAESADQAVEEHEGEEAEHAPYEVAAASAAAGESISQPPPPEDSAPEPAAPSEPDQNLLQPSTPAAARAAAPLPPLPPLDTSEFTAVRGPSTPPIPDYYLSTGSTGSGHFEAVDPPSDHRSRVPFAVAGVLVAVFAVILIGTQLIGGDDTTTADKKTPTSSQETKNTADRDPRINRAAVTVAVLNGTDTAGIAATAATGLNKAGFTDTTTGNLNDGTVHPTTIVYYAPGSKQEAQEVATELAVKDVKPATDEVLAAGGSVPVIVVLGANFGQ